MKFFNQIHRIILIIIASTFTVTSHAMTSAQIAEIVDAPIAAAYEDRVILAEELRASINHLQTTIKRYAKKTEHPSIIGVQSTINIIKQLITLLINKNMVTHGDELLNGALLDSLAVRIINTVKKLVQILRRFKADETSLPANDTELLTDSQISRSDDDCFVLICQSSSINQHEDVIEVFQYNTSWDEVKFNGGKLVIDLVVRILKRQSASWDEDGKAEIIRLTDKLNQTIDNPETMYLLDRAFETTAAIIKLARTAGHQIAERAIRTAFHDQDLVNRNGGVFRMMMHMSQH